MDQWLESHVQRHPDIAAELAWLRGASELLRDQAQSEVQTAAAQQASEAGLGLLMQRIAQEKSSQSARAALPVPAPGGRLSSWAGRWLEWFGTLGLRPPALALSAAIVLIVQAGVIAALLIQAPAQQMPLNGTVAASSADQVLLTVAFKPEATEQALRQVLAAVQAQIVGGPSALGLYTVAVPGARADGAVAQLRDAKSVVESVQR